jgi:hypothetical protein
MKMDELRRQVAKANWPVILSVDNKEIVINSRDEFMAFIGKLDLRFSGRRVRGHRMRTRCDDSECYVATVSLMRYEI